MNRRVLSLLIFRGIILAVLSLFQVLGPLVGILPIPFNVFFVISGVILVLSWVGLFLLKKGAFGGKNRWVFIWVQIFFDMSFVSSFVFFVGDDFTAAPIFYVLVILMSTLFFSRINVYLVAIFSFFSYYGVNMFSIHPELDPLQIPRYLDENALKMAGGYFIVFFTVAMVGNYLKQVFDYNFITILNQNKEISRLEFVRRKIIDSLPSGLISLNSDFRVTYANPAAFSLLEIGDSFKNKRIDEIFPLGSLNDLEGERNRMQCDMEVNGKQKTFGLALSEVEWQEGQKGKLVLFQDLTRIKQLENQQLVSSKMAAIGKVAAGVAHEIRNPLAALSGSVQVIGSMVTDNKTISELAEIVQKETKRLNHIVDQFLTYSQPLKTEGFRKINLRLIIQKFLRLVEADSLIGQFKIIFEDQMEESYIFGSSDQISQVLWNLLRNSCQSSDPGLKIWVKLKRSKENAVIEIVDGGEGMTENEKMNLFTPFQRFRKGPGLGLGLSIVYEIVQLHNGEILVESQKDYGTTIRLVFPVDNTEED